MASVLRPLRVPQCSSCIRRIASSFNESFTIGAQQQVRGKKSLAKDKDDTVKVRLLRDVIRYGKKGAIIPIAAGRMRNDFLPNKKAEYITKEQLQQLGLIGAVLERDSTFGIKVSFQRQRPEEEAAQAPIEVKVELMKPERAVQVLQMLLPANLDFYRTPIAATPAAPQRHSPSIPSSSRVSEEAEAAQAANAAKSKGVQKTGIYGSVTVADIASNLRAILAEDEEGARVVLESQDIKIIEELDEEDRVKHLGVYNIEINVKGAPLPVRRTIKVNAQD